MRKVVHVLINPLSGGKKKDRIPALIHSALGHLDYDLHIFTTHSEQETIERARTSVAENVYAILAVGGDGTINNIARFVAGTDVCLGIIALGSGNGLARYLGLYGKVQEALRIFQQGKVRALDAGWVNDRFFINVCGVGFDAHIGKLFADAGTRGLKTYAKLTLRELGRYKSKSYTIHTESGSKTVHAFMLCVCNGPQFGNNVEIAPKAIPDDGLFHVTTIHAITARNIPGLFWKILRKKHENHPKIEIQTSKELHIECEEAPYVNIDGEPVQMDASLHIRIVPASVKVFVP